MADWVTPLFTVAGSIVVALIGLWVSRRGLIEQSEQFNARLQAEEAQRNAERIKSLSERDKLEEEITAIVLTRAKVQLDEMQIKLDMALKEIAKLKIQIAQRDIRIQELEKESADKDRTIKELKTRIDKLEKGDTGPLEEKAH